MDDFESNARVEGAVRAILAYAGDDPSRTGLADTPRRVRKMYADFLSYNEKLPELTTFPRDEDGLDTDQMILVTGIPFYSYCEHHLVPFFGVAHVGYIPKEKIVGLSKIARVLDYYARRFQVQERLTAQVASTLMEGLEAQGVCVMLQAEHMCMSMRGIKKPGAKTVTHAIRGVIDKDEFLTLVKSS